MNNLGPALLILGIGVVTLITLDEREKPQREAREAAAAEVLLDGKAVTVHYLTDKKQGRTWRVIYVDRGVVVIPGSEQALFVEKP